jgi:hypothetical protein
VIDNEARIKHGQIVVYTIIEARITMLYTSTKYSVPEPEPEHHILVCRSGKFG